MDCSCCGWRDEHILHNECVTTTFPNVAPVLIPESAVLPAMYIVTAQDEMIDQLHIGVGNLHTQAKNIHQESTLHSVRPLTATGSYARCPCADTFLIFFLRLRAMNAAEITRRHGRRCGRHYHGPQARNQVRRENSKGERRLLPVHSHNTAAGHHGAPHCGGHVIMSVFGASIFSRGAARCAYPCRPLPFMLSLPLPRRSAAIMPTAVAHAAAAGPSTPPPARFVFSLLF